MPENKTSIRFSLPHNWQPDLVESLNLDCVEGFYGKLATDIIGGGRASNICPPVSRETINNEIKKIHQKGLVFNYLLNSTCLDNQELYITKKLHKFIGWLDQISVDSITVSLPYLFMFIKSNYPRFKISISVMTEVDTPDKAKYWQDLGAEKITLYESKVNRDLDLIRKIRKAVKCKLQLIVNNGCLYDCPVSIFHGFLTSHASQDNHLLRGFAIDFYRIMCTYSKISNPANFLRGDFIRPEDVHLYEELGIDSLKIVNRGMSTQALSRIINAYDAREYKGNLLDLLPTPDKNMNFKKRNLFYLAKYFFRPGLVNIFNLVKLKNIFSSIWDNIYIDNVKLDGFLQKLQEKGCNRRICSECKWCAEVASKVVVMDTEKAEQAVRENKELIDKLVSGDFFRYF